MSILRTITKASAGAAFAIFALASSSFAQAPTVSASVSPSTVGVGSSAQVTLLINGTVSPATDSIGFTYTPSSTYEIASDEITTTCAGATVSATAGGAVSMSDGALPAGSSCQVQFQVASPSAVNSAETVGPLTTSEGPTGTGSYTLNVNTGTAGFSKSFADSTIEIGGTTRLSFTVDNTAGGSDLSSILFSDTFPSGLVIADPANATADCVASIFTGGTLSATPGSDTFALVNGFGTGVFAAPAGGTCTFGVDVTATSEGDKNNISGPLSYFGTSNAGVATDSITVTPFTPGSVSMVMEFVDDPVALGGTATLRFTLQNLDRFEAATGMTFSNDLTSTTIGALATTGSLPTDPCGSGSSLTGGGTITLNSGTLPAEGSCTFDVSVAVPSSGVAPGTYTNTSGGVDATIDGTATTGAGASADLTVSAAEALVFSQVITSSSDLRPGEDLIIQFSIENPNLTGSGLDFENVGFSEVLSEDLGDIFPAVGALTDCGPGAAFPTVSNGANILQLSGATVAAGDTCQFSITLSIPTDMLPGSYSLTSSQLSADLTGGGSTLFSPETSVDYTINGGVVLNWSKEFLDDGVEAGSSTTMRITLEPSVENPIAITGVGFTDDILTEMGAGFASTAGTVNNLCGPGNGTLTGTTNLTVSGISFSAGDGTPCVIDIPISVGSGVSAGFYSNETSSLAGTAGANSIVVEEVSASITVFENDRLPLNITKEFVFANTGPAFNGESGTLRFTVQNPNSVDATNISLVDTFSFPSSPTFISFTRNAGTSDCGFAGIDGTLLIMSGATLTAGNSCTLNLDFTVPGSGTSFGDYVTGSYFDALDNSSAIVGSGTVSPTSLPTGELEIAVEPISITKAFDVADANPGQTVQLTITVVNDVAAHDGVTALAFQDDLSTFVPGFTPTKGSVVTDDCGGSDTGGATAINYTGGSFTAASCSFVIELVLNGSTPVGSYTNTVDTVSGTVRTTAFNVSSATAGLTVSAPSAPEFSKLFGSTASPVTTVNQGEDVAIEFTIANTASGAINLTDLRFTDDLTILGSTVSVGSLPTNPCGTGSSLGFASGVLELTGGNLAATETCTFSVTATVASNATTGTVTNVTSNLSNSGIDVASPATADITINASVDMGVTIDDTLTSIVAGQSLTHTISVTNTGGSDATNVSLTGTFASQLSCTIGTTTPAGGVSGITDTSTATNLNFAVSNFPVSGTLGVTLNCTVDVGASAGAITQTVSVSATENDTNATNDSATDNNTVITAVTPLTFTQAFSPTTIDNGQTSVLQYTINNNSTPVDVTGAGFTETLPTGLIVAASPAASTTCTAGTVTATAGTTGITFAGGTIDASSTCTVSVPVQAVQSGSLDTSDVLLASNFPDATATGVTLTVDAVPLTFAKAFTPATVNQGDASVLVYTISNTTTPVDATGANFSDTLPTGIVVAASPAASTTCAAGTVTATAGTTGITLAGGTISGSSSCTISVPVQALGNGALVSPTVTLASSFPDAVAAPTTLNVDAVPLTASMAFAPSTVEQFTASTLTITLTNVASIDASSISVSDTLPTNVVLAATPNGTSTCTGGTFSGSAGDSSFTYTGGGLIAGASCTVSIDVSSGVVGTYNNTSDGITSNLGASTDPSASLEVTATTLGTVTFDIDSDADGSYAFSSSESALTVSVTASGGSGSSGQISVSQGSYSASVSAPTGVAITAIACSDADSTGDAAAGTLALTVDADEDVVCTISAENSVQKTVDTINDFLTKRADLILSTQPSSNRRLNRLKKGYGEASRAAYSNGDLKSMLPFTAEVGQGDYKLSTSLFQMRHAAAMVRMAHGSTKDAEYVPNHRFDAWFEGHYKEFNAGTANEGSFSTFYFGADYLISPDVLVGAMVSFDNMTDANTAANSSASGNGWMVGPYLTARLAPNLYFDGRIAAGRSQNDVSPFNTYTDQFNTTRWLASATLSGDFQSGDWTIRPEASLSYFNETQESYVDAVGSTIPSQTIELGQITIGPTFETSFVGQDGATYSPYVGINLLRNIGSTSGVTLTDASSASTDGWRGRISAGMSVAGQNGHSVNVGVSYDGLGRDDFGAWGVSFGVEIPLNKPMAQ